MGLNECPPGTCTLLHVQVYEVPGIKVDRLHRRFPLFTLLPLSLFPNSLTLIMGHMSNVKYDSNPKLQTATADPGSPDDT